METAVWLTATSWRTSNNMNPYITAGGMRIDYLITHTGEAQIEQLGGNALYAAVGAAIWAQPVGLWARIGENYPQTPLDALQQHNIATEGVVRVPGWQEHRTFFAYTPDGRRDDCHPAAHFARIDHPLPPALESYTLSTPHLAQPTDYDPLALRPQDWPKSYAGVTAVHLSPLSLATHLAVPQQLRQNGVQQITLDPGERYMIPECAHYIQQLLPQIDVFLPSRMEIRSLFGEDASLWETAVTLHNWGAKTVAIKNGADGVYLYEGENGRKTHIPAYHQNSDKIVDITGAGDSFCGGFMVGLAQNNDPIQAAHYGTISASLVVEGYGALYALARQNEALIRLKNIRDR